MDKKKLTRSIIGMLCLLGTGSKVCASKKLKAALNTSGITLVIKEIDESETPELNSHHYDIFKQLLKDAGVWKQLVNDPSGLIIMVAIILLSIVKLVTSDNEHGWIKNRINTFSGSVGDKSWIDIWTPDLCPSWKYLSMVHSFLSAHFSLRREIFSILNNLARNETRSMIVNVCRDIIQLMRGNEMHHLILIVTDLMRKYPELKGLHVLRDLDDQYIRVINRLQKEEVEDVLFIRLLCSRDDTGELNRQNFKEASIVATTCAKFDNPTFDNYYMDKSEKAQELSELVTRYLTYRRKLTMFAIGENHSIIMGKMESEHYFKKALEDFLSANQAAAPQALSPANIRTV